MAFFPKWLKDVFARAHAPAPSPAPLAAATTPTNAAPLERAAQSKTKKLAPYLQKEGYYLFDLNLRFICDMKEEPYKGRKMLLLQSPALDFYQALINTSPLASVRGLAASICDTAQKNFDMSGATVYFRDKTNGRHIDARDDFTGLPPTGTQFQIVLIPKECVWRPTAPAPRKKPAGTSALLRPPGY